jgi:sarcosine oxidase subunit beta
MSTAYDEPSRRADGVADGSGRATGGPTGGTGDGASQLRLRTSDEVPPTADLVVVGAGIVGCATAFFATAAGLSTVVLDARPRPATLTTPASTGAFRLQFDNPEEIALVREGVELFGAFAERAGLAGYEIGLRRNGYLFCARDEASIRRQARMVAIQQAAGVDGVDLLDGEEARRRFPYLAPDVLSARFRQGDGFLDPVRLAYGFALAASGGPGVERGAGTATATFCFGARVSGFRRAGDRLLAVETAHGAIAAPNAVIATGPFLGRVAALAGLEVDVRPTRRQKLVLPDVPEVPPDAPMTIDEETAAHWRPAYAGALALMTDPTTPADEPAWNVPTSSDFAFRLLDPTSPTSIAAVTPFWRDIWARGANWFLQAGQYEYTPDRRPYLGPTSIRGLHLNGGYSGHGVMGATGGSRLVVDLITRRRTGAAWAINPAGPADNPFRPDRTIEAREHDIL